MKQLRNVFSNFIPLLFNPKYYYMEWSSTLVSATQNLDFIGTITNLKGVSNSNFLPDLISIRYKEEFLNEKKLLS